MLGMLERGRVGFSEGLCREQGEGLPRPGLGMLPSGTDPSFTLPTLELFLTSGVTCVILVSYLTLTALLGAQELHLKRLYKSYDKF